MAKQAQALALIEQPQALNAEKKYAEAAPLFKRATQLDPRSFDAWGNLGHTVGERRRNKEALAA